MTDSIYPYAVEVRADDLADTVDRMIDDLIRLQMDLISRSDDQLVVDVNIDDLETSLNMDDRLIRSLIRRLIHVGFIENVAIYQSSMRLIINESFAVNTDNSGSQSSESEICDAISDSTSQQPLYHQDIDGKGLW